jgi:malate dehydrogenase (oxaloacetate-decarboxylating)(NADP+)
VPVPDGNVCYNSTGGRGKGAVLSADTAIVPGLLESFDFSKDKSNANIPIFPDLNTLNICYKLLHHLGGAEAIVPPLMKMNKPVHVLQQRR